MKRVVLVAGVDYHFEGVNFRTLCDNRIRYLLLANKTKEEMTFYIFDFASGEFAIHEVSYPGGKQTMKSTLSQRFMPITIADFDANKVGAKTIYTLKSNRGNVMSITEVYSAVRAIGERDPGTLVELSFFSHAFQGGPVLVNSYDRTTTIQYAFLPPIVFAGLRNPDDKDPRLKDFLAPTMDAAGLDHFQKAFHPDGHVWIWGCSFPPQLHKILSKIETNPAYKESGVGDNVVFKFKNLEPDLVAVLENVLQPEVQPFPNKADISIQFKFLKWYFLKMIGGSYSYHIAKNANIKTYGALIGTDANYEKFSSTSLMRINPGLKKHVSFYQNHLGFKLDPEGRQYGEYRPNFAIVAPR